MAIIPWPTGEALAALVTQSGEIAQQKLKEASVSDIEIPAWLIKGKGGKDLPPIRIPSMVLVAVAGGMALYWYFHTKYNQDHQKDFLSIATKPGALESFMIGGPPGWALFQLATADYGKIGDVLFGNNNPTTPRTEQTIDYGPASNLTAAEQSFNNPPFQIHYFQFTARDGWKEVWNSDWIQDMNTVWNFVARERLIAAGVPAGTHITVTDDKGKRVWAVIV